MRFLAGAGVEPFDDVKDEPGDHASDDVAATSDDSEMDSDLEFYKVEKQHSVKVAAKEKMYSRSPATPLAPETLVDGKRQINYQMEKNRGLTRNRKKQDKNPRKKYRGNMRRLRNVGKDKYRKLRNQVVLMVEKLQELMLVLVEVSDLRGKFLACLQGFGLVVRAHHEICGLVSSSNARTDKNLVFEWREIEGCNLYSPSSEHCVKLALGDLLVMKKKVRGF